MEIKKRKLLKIVYSIIIVIIVGGFFINWYLNYRLERVLREKLSEHITEATGGFYKFNSKHLHIGLFNGELTLDGIELYPDSVVFKQWEAKDSLPKNYFDIQIEKIHFKRVNLIWLFSYKKLHFNLFEISRPSVKVYDSDITHRSKRKTRNLASKSLYERMSPYIDVLSVKKINLKNASIVYVGLEQPSLKLHFETKNIDIQDVKLGDDIFNLSSVDIVKPVLKINQIFKTRQINTSSSKKQDFYKILGKLAKRVSINQFNISDANIDYAGTLNGKLNRQQQRNTTNLFFTGLVLDNEKKTFALDDINFSTRNLHFPINNGFYTIKAGAIDLKKKAGSLKIEQLHLVPSYSKTEFAYHQPKHRDWFDVGVGHISLSGIDFARYFSNNILHAKELLMKDVKLLNYKNQQIEIQHNIMPMIYEELQKSPVKFDINNADLKNFKIVYEELPKKGTTTGVIFFTEMNGKLSGLTNIVSRPKQYIKLDADGKLMGAGYFTATWMLPVDSLNDHFHLKVHLHKFDLRELNQLIIPLASVKIENGFVNSLTFSTDASSKRAGIEMIMLYNNLGISVLRNKDREMTTKTFVSTITNGVLKSNNPDKKNKEPRHIRVSMERDPYHSTFNYLLQILRPAVLESVGISQKKQNFAKKVTGLIQKVKGVFQRDKKDSKEENP